MQRATSAVEPLERRGVAGGGARRSRGARRVRGGQRGLDAAAAAYRVARVLPPVRIAVEHVDVVGEDEPRRIGPAGVDGVAEPLVDLAAGADDDVGVRERLDVVRADLVVVRIGVGRQQARRRARVAADLRGRSRPPGVVVATTWIAPSSAASESLPQPDATASSAHAARIGTSRSTA